MAKNRKKTGHRWFLKITDEKKKEQWFKRFPAWRDKIKSQQSSDGKRVSVMEIGDYWNLFKPMFRDLRDYWHGWDGVEIYVRRSPHGTLIPWPKRAKK